MKTASTLANLEINYLVDASPESLKFFNKIDLSNLKVLKLHCVTQSVTQILFFKCRSLTEMCLFKIPPAARDIDLRSTIRSLGEQNPSLTQLKLCRDYFHAFFEADICETATFQLKHLTFWNKYESYFPEFIARNFLKFLAKQKQSLESISMNHCKPRMVEHLLNNMPALKYLEIKNKFQTENLRLNLNENIVELRVPSLELSEIMKLIPFAPNVTKIHIALLCRKSIKALGRHLPGLKEVMFSCLDKSIKINGRKWKSLWPNPNIIPACYMYNPTEITEPQTSTISEDIAIVFIVDLGLEINRSDMYL